VTTRQEALLVVPAAPLLAVAAVSGGLLPHTLTVPAWYLLLAAPVWEELFFRLVLQQRLQQLSWGNRRLLRLTLATWLVGAVFVLAHLPFQGVHALLLLAPALVLGRLFERTGRVLFCVLLHSWFNLCWLLAAVTAAARST
jgi:hypothetical protein